MEKKAKETLEQKIARLSALCDDEQTKTDALELSLARYQVRATEIKAAMAEIPTKASERTTDQKQLARELKRERDELRIEMTKIRRDLAAAKSADRLKEIKRNLAAHKTDDLLINLRENGVESENQLKVIMRNAERYTNLLARLSADYNIDSEDSLFALLDTIEVDEKNEADESEHQNNEETEADVQQNQEAKAEEQNDEEKADEDEIQTA